MFPKIEYKYRAAGHQKQGGLAIKVIVIQSLNIQHQYWFILSSTDPYSLGTRFKYARFPFSERGPKKSVQQGAYIGIVSTVDKNKALDVYLLLPHPRVPNADTT